MTQFENILNIQHIKTTAFHLQSNGNIERMHSTLVNLIKTSIIENNKQWHEKLKYINLPINTTTNQTTGHSPYESTFGRTPNIRQIKSIKSIQIQRIIPHPLQNVYFSIIPDHDYVIKYRDSYVLTDKETVSNCKEISEYKICFRNQPSIKLLDTETCKATLFKRYVDNKCEKSPFLLHRETFIPITNGYIVIPLKELDLDSACKNNIKQKRIFEPSLLLGNKYKIYNNYDTI